ncbi:MAG: TolC family protein [Treponema sp.]|nr:TolC family protein [Treponema sp.]
MNRTKFLAAGLLGFGLAAFAQGQATEPEKVTLTVDQAVEYALQNSRTLKSAQIDLEMKDRAAKYGWNVLLPSLNVTGTMSRSNEYNPSNMLMNPTKSNFDDEEERWNAIGGVSFGWNFSAAMIQQIRASKAAFEGGKISWEQSQIDTTMQIRKFFYGLLLQQENLKIQQTTLENSRQRASQAQTNYRNGIVPEISYLQAEVTYQNLIPDMEQKERELAQSFDMLGFLIGFPVGTDFELVGEIEPTYIEANSDDLLARYGGSNLDILSLQSNIDQLKLGISAGNLGTWIPALSVNFALQPAYIGDKGAWHFWGDLGKDEKWYDSGSLSLTLAWNIANMLPWSKNQQGIADNKAKLKQAELAMETMRENQKMEVRKAVDTLNQAREQIDAMGRTVTLAQRAYEMSARSYRNGTMELLDLRDAEKSLNDAKFGQLNQKYNYICALMDLEKALGVVLSDLQQSEASAGQN